MRLPRLSLLSQVISVLVLVTLVCGMIGYHQVATSGAVRAARDLDEAMRSPGPLGQFLDLFYLSCLLLWLGAKNTFGNQYLMVGRWTGAFVAFISVVKLLTPRLELWGQRLRVKTLRGHTIVIGMTEMGRCFLRDSASRRPAVGLDSVTLDLEDLGLAKRSKRVFLQQGDVTKAEVLRRTGLDRAATIIIASGDDVTNLAIARRILHILEQGGGAAADLDIVVHVADPGLRLTVLSRVPARVSLRLISVPALVARNLLATWPFAVQARLMGVEQMHLVFLDFDQYSEELLLQTLRMGPLIGQQPPRVTIFAPDRERTELRLSRNYPAMSDFMTLEVRDLNPEIEISDADMLAVEGPHAEFRVTDIIVVADSDNAAVVLARRARAQTHYHARWQAPIFVHIKSPAEFSDVVAPIRHTKRLSSVIEPFGDINELCSAAGLLDWHEVQAKNVHINYQSEVQIARRGLSPKEVQVTNDYSDRKSPAERWWNEIEEEYREACRRAVDNFPIKLASLGYVVRGAVPRLGSEIAFSKQQMDALARAEHDSWFAEKRLAGWRYGNPRDSVRKLHHCLVPFDQLDQDQREKDIKQVRLLGRVFAQDLGREVPSGFGRGRSEDPPSIFRERTIGLVGHTHLTLDFAKAIRAQIREMILSNGESESKDKIDTGKYLDKGGDEFWTFVTPLAPGADLILARAVSAALKEFSAASRHRRRYRIVTANALSFESLAAAYLQSRPSPDSTPDGETRLDVVPPVRLPLEIDTIANTLQTFVDATECCEMVIDIPQGKAPPSIVAGGRDERASDFRATNDYLLRSCDDLIAVLDVRRYGYQGGFSVADWRTVNVDGLPAHGTGALVRAWLDPPQSRRRRLPSLFTDGLCVIEPKSGPA